MQCGRRADRNGMKGCITGISSIVSGAPGSGRRGVNLRPDREAHDRGHALEYRLAKYEKRLDLALAKLAGLEAAMETLVDEEAAAQTATAFGTAFEAFSSAPT